MTQTSLFGPPPLPGSDAEINAAVAREIFGRTEAAINFLTGAGLMLLVERMRSLGWLYGVRTELHAKGAAIYFFRGKEEHVAPGNEFKSAAEAALRAVRSER